MQSVGQRFRDERVRQGRDIKPIADDLRIASRYIQAIEDDKLDQLPGGFIGRSFIKQYAVALGLNPADFECLLPAVVVEVPEPTPAQAIVLNRKEKDIEVAPLLPPKGKGFFDLKTWSAVAGLVVAVVAGSSLYSWFEDSRNGKTASVARMTTSSGSNDETAKAPASSSVSSAGDLLSLSVAATEATWLEISSNGNRLFSGLLNAGQSKEFDKTESARMVVGNAGGVVIRRAGRDIGPIGSRGQVRVLLFRPDAWEIIQAVPQVKADIIEAPVAGE